MRTKIYGTVNVSIVSGQTFSYDHIISSKNEHLQEAFNGTETKFS